MSSYFLILALCALLFPQLIPETTASARSRHLKRFWRPNVSGKGSTSDAKYKVKYFTQRLDHFNLADNRTFQQRYLVDDNRWDGMGPILLYTGNEGDITWFYDNTGFVTDYTAELHGLALFIEHRYYGESLPFGNLTYQDKEHLGYLSSQQALADFAVIVTELKENVYNTSRPVFAVGGSYGGMLAAWMRMKYPHIVLGSIAASAPIWWFSGLTPCNSAAVTITKDFEDATVGWPDNPYKCSESIQKSWAAIDSISSKTDGLTWLSNAFHLCHSLNLSYSTQDLKDWLQDTWFNLAMVDYPVPANFLAPLPAWPVNKTCQHLSKPFDSDEELLEAVGLALGVYYNNTGNTKCYSLDSEATLSLEDQGWKFQACTEMVMPQCSDGVTDMFQAQPWDLKEYEKACMAQFGVTPQPYLVELLYGGKNINTSSNILFSNGLLDPWHGGGVLEDISATLTAVVIPDGAHHFDLRASQANDTKSVYKARLIEAEQIMKWIIQYDQ